MDLEKVALHLPVVTRAAYAGLTSDPLVHRRVMELSAAQDLLQMRKAASEGDWTAVETLLAQATERYGDNEWVKAILESMQRIAQTRERRRMLKEAMYSASAMNLRLSARDEEVYLSMRDEAAQVPSYLRRKAAQGKGQ